MPIFQYLHFVCFQDELDTRLNQYGSEGWRLHTCEPVVVQGPSGSGLMQAFVVMDKTFTPSDHDVTYNQAEENEGIPMKG